MVRVLRKILKKLGNALRLHAALEKMNLEAEIDALLSRQQLEKEAKEEDLEGHLARYATQLDVHKISVRTLQGKSMERRNHVMVSFRRLEPTLWALAVTKEGYKKSLEELQRSEVVPQNVNNEVSSLTAKGGLFTSNSL